MTGNNTLVTMETEAEWCIGLWAESKGGLDTKALGRRDSSKFFQYEQSAHIERIHNFHRHVDPCNHYYTENTKVHACAHAHAHAQWKQTSFSASCWLAHRILVGEAVLRPLQQHTSSPSHLSSPASLCPPFIVVQFLPPLSSRIPRLFSPSSVFPSGPPLCLALCPPSFPLYFVLPPTPSPAPSMKWLRIHSLNYDWPNIGHLFWASGFIGQCIIKLIADITVPLQIMISDMELNNKELWAWTIGDLISVVGSVKEMSSVFGILPPSIVLLPL